MNKKHFYNMSEVLSDFKLTEKRCANVKGGMEETGYTYKYYSSTSLNLAHIDDNGTSTYYDLTGGVITADSPDNDIIS